MWEPRPIGEGREREVGTIEFPLDWIPHERRNGQADAARLVEIYAEVEYSDQSTGRSGTVSVGPRLIENIPPCPIEVRWGGGNMNGWNEVSRTLEISLRGQGPVRITEIDAVMWHRDDPDTFHHAMQHSLRRPTTLGGEHAYSRNPATGIFLIRI